MVFGQFLDFRTNLFSERLRAFRVIALLGIQEQPAKNILNIFWQALILFLTTTYKMKRFPGRFLHG